MHACKKWRVKRKMIVKNASESEIRQALALVNRDFDNNLEFNNYERISETRIRLTLKVRDSKKKGSKLGYNGRHIINACWHAHGYFFEALLSIQPKAVIKSALATITANSGNWTDTNIGSIMEPLYFSEACECDKFEDIEVQKLAKTIEPNPYLENIRIK